MTLPDGWKQGRLGELCSIEIGGTPSRGVAAYWDYAHGTTNVWVSIKDMRQRLIKESTEQISVLGVKKSNVKLQRPGTVLLSFKLTIGRVAIAAVPLFTNEAIAGLSPTGLTRDFLYQGLQGWDLLQGVDQAIKGATLNKQKLKRILFEYPESEREQAKIAEVLSTVDRAIEETEALIAKQQRIKTGLMQDLLTRGIDEHGNLRSEQTHEFKDSPLGRIPAGWAVATLNQLTPTDAPIGYGIVQPGAYDPSGVRVAGIYTISSDFEKWHMSSSAIEAAYQRSRIRPGDVLLSIKGSTGRVGVVPPSIQGNISREIARIRPTAALNPHFIRFQLLSNSYQRYLLNAEVGTTRAELSIKVLRELSVAVPPRAEQNKIALRLASAERHLNATHLWLKKLRRVKTGHMQELLTGKRRVTPLLEQCEAVTT